MRIAVLISSLLFDTQKAFMKGIERRVRDYKDVCSVFACHVNAGSNEKHTQGEYAIFDLPDFSTFDGVVYVRNTFQFSPSENKIERRLRESGVNCVVIDGTLPGYVSIISDEKDIMKCATTHLIEEHGCKKLGFVGGHSFSNDTRDRFAGFLEALNEHGLEYDPDYRIDGNFQYFSGSKAARHFMNLEGGLPDGVCCANDEMAIGLCSEFRKRGVKVPKGIKITGVDYDSVSRIYAPRLTTVKRQQYQKGVSAITILHEYDSHEKGEVITLETSFVPGETCGCKPELAATDPNTINAIATEKYVSEELAQYIRLMNADFMSSGDIHDTLRDIRRHTERMQADEVYLILIKRPSLQLEYSDYVKALAMEDRDNQEEYLDPVVSVVNYIDGKCLPSSRNEEFSVKDLFPPMANGGKPGGTYYFLPIHYMNRNFGYAIQGTSGDAVRDDFVPSWANAVNIALENTRKRTVMLSMIDTLDHMWIYDTLTDVYNRAGFLKVIQAKFEKCVEEKTPVALIFMDVDGLKTVNDQYGHEEGDILIKSVAQAIREVSDIDTENYMRYGGDEFVVTIVDGDENKVSDWKNRFEKSLAKIAEGLGKPYRMEVSLGSEVTVLNSFDELPTLLDEADHKMYLHKKEKRAGRS